MNTKKPLLKKVDVPWMISVSGSFFTVTFREERESDITFHAILAPNKGESMVKICFDTHLYHIIDERSSIDEKYEYQSVLPKQKEGEPSNEWYKRYKQKKEDIWKETGFSPNSYFYTVEDSELLKKYNRDLQLKHYLLVGCDCYIEVIAKGFKWEYI